MARTGYIIGGLLSGIGQGMAQQAQSDAQARREIALENLRSQNKRAETETAHGYRVAEMGTQADLNDRNDARKTERDTSSKIIVGNAETKNQISIDNAKSKNDAVLARLQSGLRMNEEQSKSAQRMVEAATQAGQEVKDTVVGTDGTLYIIAKDGRTLSKSKPGMFNPTGQSAADDSGGTISGAIAGRGGAPAREAVTQSQPKTIRYDAQGNRIQ